MDQDFLDIYWGVFSVFESPNRKNATNYGFTLFILYLFENILFMDIWLIKIATKIKHNIYTPVFVFRLKSRRRE